MTETVCLNYEWKFSDINANEDDKLHHVGIDIIKFNLMMMLRLFCLPSMPSIKTTCVV